MSERRVELAALIVLESGKPWKEADADLCEAVDFCHYYADQAQQLLVSRPTVLMAGETNTYSYQARGICAVISPWNFPLAICCGMTVAALVAGNSVALKPAEQSSAIAKLFVDILLEAGLPPESIAFLPGLGEEVGEALVSNVLTDMICFTGSQNVGLSILEKSAKVLAGQRSIKKVITELGGKNCIIVDSDADLDEAIKGILYSAFGFAGQKCSACSRVVAVGDVYPLLLERLVDAAADISVGPADLPESYLGPVVDGETHQRICSLIDTYAAKFSLAFKGNVPEGGYFVPVTIFKDVPHDSKLWTEEIFGPVLALSSVESFAEAISVANSSKYALTGGVYSRSPANLEYARKRFQVGNLYLNRACTGAIVARHPFGGFKMSGVGSKAGGPDYLIQFVEPRTVSENTMRRGFAPE